MVTIGTQSRGDKTAQKVLETILGFIADDKALRPGLRFVKFAFNGQGLLIAEATDGFRAIRLSMNHFHFNSLSTEPAFEVFFTRDWILEALRRKPKVVGIAADGLQVLTGKDEISLIPPADFFDDEGNQVLTFPSLAPFYSGYEDMPRFWVDVEAIMGLKNTLLSLEKEAESLSCVIGNADSNELLTVAKGKTYHGSFNLSFYTKATNVPCFVQKAFYFTPKVFFASLLNEKGTVAFFYHQDDTFSRPLRLSQEFQHGKAEVFMMQARPEDE